MKNAAPVVVAGGDFDGILISLDTLSEHHPAEPPPEDAHRMVYAPVLAGSFQLRECRQLGLTVILPV